MKIKESGMPEEKMWENFFVPDRILRTLGLNQEVKDVADFGCGYGTFTVPAAKIVKGEVYAIDIEPKMIEETQKGAREYKLNNIKTMLLDFMSKGSGLGDKSVDYVLLFNILTKDKPNRLLEEAYRILKPEGRVGIIHWNYDTTTPRGPPMELRLKPKQSIELAVLFGFNNPKMYNLKPYHYGIVLRK